MDKTVEFPAEHDGFTLVGCGIGGFFFFFFPLPFVGLSLKTGGGNW